MRGNNLTALDLWELADHFGEKVPITVKDYANYYGRCRSEKASMRAFDRLKARVRSGPFPAEFVQVYSELGYDDSEGRQLAIVLHRGTRETTARILDNKAGL